MKKLTKLTIVSLAAVGVFFGSYHYGVKNFTEEKALAKSQISVVDVSQKPKDAEYTIALWNMEDTPTIAEQYKIDKGKYGYQYVCKFMVVEEGKPLVTKQIYCNHINIQEITDMPKAVVNKDTITIYVADKQWVKEK